VYVPYLVAGPVQYEQGGNDTDGHALASYFVGSNQTHLHLQDGQIGIFQEVFQQGQEREETLWYQFYGHPRQSVLRRTATCARSMGAHIPYTTLVRFKKTERRKPISAPLRKVERKVIL
jgi:hypothetical protein